MNSTIYLRAGQFSKAILNVSRRLAHPLGIYHSCSPNEVLLAREAIIEAAEDSESEYIEFYAESKREYEERLKNNPDALHVVPESDLAVGLILPIPGIKDYVLVSGAYLGSAKDRTLQSELGLESTKMTLLKLHSPTTWLVPTKTLKKQAIRNTPLRVNELEGQECLQVVCLSPSKHFQRQHLESCAFTEPVFTVLALTAGFIRLYQREIFFREDRMFLNEPHEYTLGTVELDVPSNESEFVQVSLMPSYMNLLSVILKFNKKTLTVIKANGLGNESTSNSLKWITQQTETTLLHFFNLYDSLSINCGRLAMTGKREPFGNGLLSNPESFANILAKTLHTPGENMSGKHAKFRRLCPEITLFSMNRYGEVMDMLLQNRFNKGISLISIYGEISVTFTRSASFGIRAKPILDIDVTPAYTIVPVSSPKDGKGQIDVAGKRQSFLSSNTFHTREEAEQTLQKINEVQGLISDFKVASIGMALDADLIDEIDKTYQPMLKAFKTMHKALST